MIDYSVDALIEDVKRRASVPTSQNLFLDQDFVDFLDEELQSYIVPFVLSVREDYLVHHKDYDVSDGETHFELPDDAVGKRAKSVALILGDEEVEIPRLNISDLPNTLSMPSPNGYYVKGDDIVLKGSFDRLDGLRIYYYKRPNKLVLPSDAGRVISVNVPANEITLDNLPASWDVNTRFDIIKGKPSFRTRTENIAYVNKSGFTLEFADVSMVEVGDYVAEHNHSPVAQVPWELHKLLSQAVAVKCLEALGDAQGLQGAVGKLSFLEDKAKSLITSRVDSHAKVIIGKRTIWGY